MARSRVGGSSGLLSGKVGDVIYSITRNADGSFRQSISANPDGRFNPNTDDQARARLTMAMIERAMFTYRDFMGTGFEGVQLGTNSVSKFSEVNYNVVKQDILDYWDVEDWPEWNYDFPRKGQTTPKDGCFIISQGTLRLDLHIHVIGASGTQRWFGIETTVIQSNVTMKRFLDLNNLKPGMQFVGIFFCQGTTPSKSFIAWLMFWTDPDVPMGIEITSANWRKYIHTNSNVTMNSYYVPDSGQLMLRCERLDDYQVARTGCMGRRVRIKDGDKFRYNNCEMEWVTFSTPQEDWGWKTLWDVKPTWINE